MKPWRKISSIFSGRLYNAPLFHVYGRRLSVQNAELLFLPTRFCSCLSAKNLNLSNPPYPGIVIESFGNIKKDKEIEGLTSMQQEWVETQKAIEKMRYHAALRPPAKRSFARALRASFFNLVQHPYFDRAFAAAIALNLVILCTQEVPPGARTRAVARYSGWIFAGVFSAEVAAKLLGLGVRQFFQHRWNLFDLVILVMTITGEAMADRPGAPLVRCFRVLRMLKLAR